MMMMEYGWSYSCTTCPRTGEACAAGLRLARQLHAALRAGGSTIGDDFEMSGHGRLEGSCGQECGAVYSLCKRGFRVYCGVSEDADPDQLDRFAAGFLGDGPIGSGPFPRAMVIGTAPEASAMADAHP